MSNNNPFILKNKRYPSNSNRYSNKTTNKKTNKKIYTNEEIKTLLNGYIIVPKDKWDDIPNDAHIRYFKLDNTFVRGGFVVNKWSNNEGKKFIHLSNNLNKNINNYATWPVALESTSKIFIKPNKNTNIELSQTRDRISDIIRELNKLVSVIKKQEQKIISLENDIKILKQKY